jgi:hypothetical protein
MTDHIATHHFKFPHVRPLAGRRPGYSRFSPIRPVGATAPKTVATARRTGAAQPIDLVERELRFVEVPR